MSVNPSQSWITPETALFGTGGGSNFSQGITIGTGAREASFSINNAPYSVYNPTILDVSGQIASNLVVGSVIASYNLPSTAQWRAGNYTSDTISYQQMGSGTGQTFLNVNNSTLSLNAGNYFNLFGLSTINAGSNTANAVALMSSLRGTFPTSFQ